MLLIGDIHINSKIKDNLIFTLKDFIQKNPEEENIIFLGDYVYHFAYDRSSLLDLYDFFVDLFIQGKSIYLLAGNHDRLGQNFVYEEAQKAFDILSYKFENNKKIGKIYFITKPKKIIIEGENILFLPYMLFGSLNIKDISQKWTYLLESENKKEKMSGEINEYIEQNIENNEKITIIHHYYFNNTIFPGQKSRFKRKDVALSEKLFDRNVKLISGHLHMPFVYKNYLCLGSVWSTSPLEINQIKCLGKYIPKKNKIIMQEISINPYIFLELKKNNNLNNISILNKNDIENQFDEIILEFKNNFAQSEIGNIEFKENKNRNYRNFSISIKVSDLDYEKIDEYIDKDLRISVKDVRLKKNLVNLQEITEKLNITGKDLSTGFSDWKEILKLHLKNKYSQDYDKYLKVLHNLNLL